LPGENTLKKMRSQAGREKITKSHTNASERSKHLDINDATGRHRKREGEPKGQELMLKILIQTKK